MAAYDNLRAVIAANVYQNNNNEVTADMVKTAMEAMVASLGAEFQFGGVAEPDDNHGTPDYKVAYLASTPGTYTKFDGIEVADGEVVNLKWDGTAWSKEVVAVFLTKDEFNELVSFVETYCVAYNVNAITPTIEQAKCFDADGNIIGSSTYDLYKFPVTPGNMYILAWSRGRYYNQYVIAWYDSYGAYISKEDYRGSMDEVITHPGDLVTAPVGAAFAYVNVQTARASMYSFSEKVFVPANDIKDALYKTIQETALDILQEDEVPVIWEVGKYVKDDNTLGNISTPDYRACKDVFVGNAEKIRWFLVYGGTARVVTTDANHQIINVYTDRAIEIDNTSHTIQYISLSNNFDQLANPKLYISTFVPINEQVKKLSALAGKPMAVLGDSIMMLMSEGNITGNTVTYVGTDGVIYDLEDLTNIGGLLYVTATLEDGAVGPATIQADIHNSKQASMNEESWLPLKDALGASSVINTGRGGATITGNVITTSYPAHAEPTFNTIPNHCLELKRRVDAGAESPALIMIWAGTNDVAKFVSGGAWVEPTNFDEIMALDYETKLLADTDEAMAYKRTFYGGLRFCIEFLSRNFPDAQIVFFSPIQSVVALRNYERILKVGSYIKKMVDRYSLVFVDACVTIGISDIFDTADTHRYLYDGLHPNDAGKALYCAYTTKQLRDICIK